MQGEGQKEILGMRSQSIQPFSRLLLQLISMLFMCAPSPFQSWNLHHPVHIKPALEVKLMHTGEEVIWPRKHLSRQKINSNHSLWSFPHGNSCWGYWWDLWHPPLHSFFLRILELLGSVSHSVGKACFCHLSPEIFSVLRQGNYLISPHADSFLWAISHYELLVESVPTRCLIPLCQIWSQNTAQEQWSLSHFATLFLESNQER